MIVDRVLVAGNRDGINATLSFQVITATVELLDKDQKQVSVAPASAQGPAGDFEFQFKTPVKAVRSIRFKSMTDYGGENVQGKIALGEVRVD